MPELPEVETTKRMLDKLVKSQKILDIWTDYDSSFHKGKGNIKDKKYFTHFRKEVLGQKVLGVRRMAKNVLIDVSRGKTILVHMKMTGHLLYGKYNFDGKKWFPASGDALKDPFNRFVHLVFILSNGKHLVLSDARKFAKVFVFNTGELDNQKDLSKLGPEPLEKGFDYRLFKQRFLMKPSGKIKTVLMDQNIISGVGNIYSDEVLWFSGVHPEERVRNIPEDKLKKIFKNIKIILQQSIKLGGDSMSDYRNPLGEKGGYQKIHKVYRRTGEICKLKGCGGIIKRIKVGGRSAHFCEKHQKLLIK